MFLVIHSIVCSIGKDLCDDIVPAPNPIISGDYEVIADKAGFQRWKLKHQRDLGLITSFTTL